jgi:hypothetical protein
MGLASIGSSLANVSLLHRFLEGIISLIALTIVSAMMAGMLILTGLYGIYVVLTRYGLTPDAALVTIIALGLAITLALVSLTYARLRHLRSLPELILPRNFLPLARTARLTQAFMEGFRSRSKI